MRRSLLIVVYYVFLVPISALVRLFHDPLDRKWSAERETYWAFVADGGAASGAAPAAEDDVADPTRSRPAAA